MPLLMTTSGCVMPKVKIKMGDTCLSLKMLERSADVALPFATVI